MLEVIPERKKVSWDDLLFAYIILVRTKRPQTVLPSTAFTTLIPLVILTTAVFFSSFVILSNNQYLDSIIDEASARARTQEEREVVEMSREGNKEILQNPGLRFLISGKVMVKYVLSLGILLVLFWLALAAISGKWDGVMEFCAVAMFSTAPLLFGVVLTFVLRWSLLIAGEPLSLAMILNQPDYSSIQYRFLAAVDPFRVWFIWFLATRLSVLYQESRVMLFALFLLVTLTASLGCSLLGFDLGFGT